MKKELFNFFNTMLQVLFPTFPDQLEYCGVQESSTLYFDPADEQWSKDHKDDAANGLCFCDVFTVGVGVAAVGAATTTIIAQNNARQTAKGTENLRAHEQDNAIIENRRRATQDFMTQVRLENTQQTQEQEVVAEKSIGVRTDARKAKGTALASAAERGVAGNAVDAVLSDYIFQQNQEITKLRINQHQQDVQHGENIAAFGTSYSNRIADVKPYVPQNIAPVDYFGPVFGAIGTTASSAGSMYAAKQKAAGTQPTT